MGSELEPYGERPSGRADVVFYGVSVDGAQQRVEVSSHAPVGSASEAGNAVLQSVLATGVISAVIAGVCQLAGAPVWVTVTLSITLITVIVVIIGVMAYVIVGNYRRS